MLTGFARTRWPRLRFSESYAVWISVKILRICEFRVIMGIMTGLLGCCSSSTLGSSTNDYCIIRPAPSGAGRTTPSQPGHYPLINLCNHYMVTTDTMQWAQWNSGRGLLNQPWPVIPATGVQTCHAREIGQCVIHSRFHIAANGWCTLPLLIHEFLEGSSMLMPVKSCSFFRTAATDRAASSLTAMASEWAKCRSADWSGSH